MANGQRQRMNDVPLGLSIPIGYISGHEAHLRPLWIVLFAEVLLGLAGGDHSQDRQNGLLGPLVSPTGSRTGRCWLGTRPAHHLAILYGVSKLECVFSPTSPSKCLILWVWGRARGFAICISSKFPGVADAAEPAITLWKPLLHRCSYLLEHKAFPEDWQTFASCLPLLVTSRCLEGPLTCDPCIWQDFTCFYPSILFLNCILFLTEG